MAAKKINFLVVYFALILGEAGDLLGLDEEENI